MVTDMTKGKPFGVLCRFTLPMLLSVMFQQFYNIVDSIVAGKFVGVQGLAAVGASYPVTMLYMAVATGLNVGCSVVIAPVSYTHLSTCADAETELSGRRFDR